MNCCSPASISDIGEKNKTRAIIRAIEDYLEKSCLEKVCSLQGNLDLEDNWKEMEAFEMKEIEEDRSGIKAMIISIGGTPAPIIKSISEYKPEFVSFLASQDTHHLINSIKEELAALGINIKSELTLADDVNDLFHCHEKAVEAVKRVLSKKYDKNEVIVDYTGGTKNMSVSLSLAAIAKGFCFSYVGGKERTKNGVGIVVNGQEEVYHCINPWDFLAMEEKKKISLLFNQCQFKAAKEIIDELCEKNIKNKALFKKLGFMVEGYYRWDLFQHNDALDRFKRAKIDDITPDEDAVMGGFAGQTFKRLKFLKDALLAGDSGKKPCLPYILDLFANAERRCAEGKIDDAVLRIYRLVEMGAQERLLKKYQIDVSDVKADDIPEKMREEFMKYKGQRDGKIKIPQAAAFDLLNELGDDLGKLFIKNKNDFLDIQTSRNYSYLAHGFESSRDKTYVRFRNFVLSLELFRQEEVPFFPEMRL